MSDTDEQFPIISFPISEEAAAKLWQLPGKITWTPLQGSSNPPPDEDPLIVAEQAIREMVAFPGGGEVPVSGDWDDDYEDGKWRPQKLSEYLANTHISGSSDDLMRRAASAVIEALRDKGLLLEP